jgi:hypothetical protein
VIASALTVAVALAGIDANARDATDAARATLALMMERHRAVAGLVVESDVAFWLDDAAISVKQRDEIGRAGRVRTWVDPSGGPMRVVLHTQRVEVADPVRVRKETVNLTYIGPEDGARDFELILPTMLVRRGTLLTSAAEIYPIVEKVDDDLRWRRDRKVTMAEMAAQLTYPTFVLWAGGLLALTDDLSGQSGGGRHRLSSATLGLELIVDEANGEVDSIAVIGPREQRSRFEFQGRLDEPTFPARHPRMTRAFTSSKLGEEVAGPVMVFTRVGREVVAEARFEPGAMATRFVRGIDRVPCDVLGKPLDDRHAAGGAEPYERLPVLVGAELARREEGGPSWGRASLATAVACFVVAGVIWWRRRHGG